jgi:hypothetical protein
VLAILLASTALAIDIPARQRELHVPAVSIAVIENGRIVKTEVYGEASTRRLYFKQRRSASR